MSPSEQPQLPQRPMQGDRRLLHMTSLLSRIAKNYPSLAAVEELNLMTYQTLVPYIGKIMKVCYRVASSDSELRTLLGTTYRVLSLNYGRYLEGSQTLPRYSGSYTVENGQKCVKLRTHQNDDSDPVVVTLPGEDSRNVLLSTEVRSPSNDKKNRCWILRSGLLSGHYEIMQRHLQPKFISRDCDNILSILSQAHHTQSLISETSSAFPSGLWGHIMANLSSLVVMEVGGRSVGCVEFEGGLYRIECTSDSVSITCSRELSEVGSPSEAAIPSMATSVHMQGDLTSITAGAKQDDPCWGNLRTYTRTNKRDTVLSRSVASGPVRRSFSLEDLKGLPTIGESMAEFLEFLSDPWVDNISSFHGLENAHDLQKVLLELQKENVLFFDYTYYGNLDSRTNQKLTLHTNIDMIEITCEDAGTRLNLVRGENSLTFFWSNNDRCWFELSSDRAFNVFENDQFVQLLDAYGYRLDPDDEIFYNEQGLESVHQSLGPSLIQLECIQEDLGYFLQRYGFGFNSLAVREILTTNPHVLVDVLEPGNNMEPTTNYFSTNDDMRMRAAFTPKQDYDQGIFQPTQTYHSVEIDIGQLSDTLIPYISLKMPKPHDHFKVILPQDVLYVRLKPHQDDMDSKFEEYLLGLRKAIEIIEGYTWSDGQNAKNMADALEKLLANDDLVVEFTVEHMFEEVFDILHVRVFSDKPGGDIMLVKLGESVCEVTLFTDATGGDSVGGYVDLRDSIE
jgi:hypothetical protein